MRQIKNNDIEQQMFISLLPRFRSGDCTLEDYNHLKKRIIKPSLENDFIDAIRIFAYNDTCSDYNMKKLNSLKSPITLLKSVNNPNYGKNFPSDQFRGLTNLLYLCIGAKVIITTNIWKKCGLVNGATGTIMDILYINGKCSNLPDIIIVEVDNYNGPPFFNDELRKKWIPFNPLTVYNKTSNTSRTQYPFKLAYAITCHKAQGQTLDKGVIDFGHSERSLGSSYVQLTRFKKFTDFVILPFTYERITSVIKNSKKYESRQNEELRLNMLLNDTLNKYNKFNFLI